MPTTPQLDSIPLDRAVLCLDCRMITQATNGHCPVCQSSALVRVQLLIDREDNESTAPIPSSCAR